jgi:hypothetical protein
MDPHNDSEAFFPKYFRYVGPTEAPAIYHRWTIISAVGALLARQFYLPFGHNTIYPNMYVWLVGPPGARKGTAMNPMKNVLRELQYKKISPQRLSPEMFLSQLQKLNLPEATDILSELEIEELPMDEIPCEIYVVADELADFIRGNSDFCKVLTNLWDNLPSYDHPKLHGRSVYIHKPTINIIGGITPEDIMLSVPPSAIGQGFFSRLILVHSEPTGIQITMPPVPSKDSLYEVVMAMTEMMEKVQGKATIAADAERILDAIYKKFVGIDNVQFKHYNSRRFVHLLKVCLIFAALDCSLVIRKEHVLKANTLMYVTEQRMPKALGEFGKAKNASVTHNVIEALKSTTVPLTIKDLWRLTVNDLNKMEDLVEIIKGLEMAEKIQRISISGKIGFMPLNKHAEAWHTGLTWDEKGFLYAEEMV